MGNVAFFPFHWGDPILNELCGYFIVPSGSYAVFDLFFTVGTEAFDGEEKGWAAHFWGCDSESYVSGCPDRLLHEYFIVDLAQGMYEESGREVVLGLFPLLPCALVALFGYNGFKFLFLHW